MVVFWRHNKMQSADYMYVLIQSYKWVNGDATAKKFLDCMKGMYARCILSVPNFRSKNRLRSVLGGCLSHDELHQSHLNSEIHCVQIITDDRFVLSINLSILNLTQRNRIYWKLVIFSENCIKFHQQTLKLSTFKDGKKFKLTNM